jgi:hypothetical protein
LALELAGNEVEYHEPVAFLILHGVDFTYGRSDWPDFPFLSLDRHACQHHYHRKKNAKFSHKASLMNTPDYDFPIEQNIGALTHYQVLTDGL